MTTRPRVVRVDLGLSGLDPATCLERLLRPGLRGFLIEKTEEGRKRAWLGAAPFEMLTVERGRAFSEARGRKRALSGNPFAALGRRLAEFRARGGEPFDGGAVGLLGYEMVRHLERVPVKPEPYEAVLMLFDEVIVVEDGRASLRALVSGAKGRRRAQARGRELKELLRWAGPVPDYPASRRLLPARGRRGRDSFLRGVARIKEHIRAGDVFQAVLSDDFHARVAAGPIAAYRAIRAANPTPYLFLLMGGDDAVMGASPERLVRVLGGRARNCPIAGTRPRGRTRAEDRRLEGELRASEKERAEHLMLVDLARNDLGRVCAPGSVKVERFMFTRRFSNVMHLVSEVEGRLDAGRTAWDALAASFPAGTVSGAPKVRAMELIASLERKTRGFYAGAVVQHDFAGNLDSCLAIRSLSLSKGGKARLQAGAGIVADSSPIMEYREVQHKLAGLRRALGEAAGVILLLDNYDSFTYNLYQAVRALGAPCRVVRNDALSARALLALKPKGLILSPGPGRPEDAGVLVDLIRRAPASLPVLGVCLGHQAIALAGGGRVVRAKHLMHGKTCRIAHDGRGVYAGLPRRLTVARYHSLVAAEPLPEGFSAVSRAEDGSLMGLRRADRPVEGVQFHPESVATPLGLKMLRNFLALTRARRS